jgi:outer membrane protein
MKSFIFTAFLFILTLQATQAQVKERWDLRRCVEYAMKKNVSVRAADITARQSEIGYKQTNLSQIPSLAYNLNHGFSFGRTLDRTSNVYVSRSAMFQQMSLQANTLLFNFNSTKNNIAAQKYQWEADKAATDKAANDIGLNVAQQYLRTMLSMEQVELNRVILGQTRAQYNNTRKLVDAGSLPELNAAELEATYTRDSATLLQSQVQVDQDMLSLKALLTLPADYNMDIETPPIDKIPVDNIISETPESVFAMAMKSQPQIRGNELRLISAQKALASAKGQLYPSLTAFAQLNTSFNSFLQSPTGYTVTGETPTGTYAKSGVNQYPVYAPTGVISYGKNSFGQLWNGYWGQLNDQFGQAVGLGLSVPIFNGWRTRANIERGKLAVERSNLQIESDTLKLKQDVYTAYNLALGNYQLYLARIKALETAERSYDLATKRYELGVMQTIEWLNNQTALATARINKLIAQYNYVFAMKVLEFYKGQGVRL